MPEPILPLLALALGCLALAGWLLTALTSLVARIRTGRPQSYRMPWWGTLAFGLAALLIVPALNILYLVIIGPVLLIAGLLAATDVRFRPFGEFAWWDPNAPASLANNSPFVTAVARQLDSNHAAEPLPARAPGDPAEYDGCANYVEEARKEAAADGLAPLVKHNLDMPSNLWRLLNAVQNLVGIGVGLLVGYWAVLWVDANIHGEVGMGGIIFWFGILLAAVFGFSMFVTMGLVIARRWQRWQALVLYDSIALLFVWFGWVRPVFLS